MRIDEAVAQELIDNGVRSVFGILGIETARLGAELHRRDTAFVAARHENQAVAMAAGYARVSGSVGVAINSRGPGLSNGLTAIAAAAKARCHVLIISGAPRQATDGPSGTGRSDWKHLDEDALVPLVDAMYVRPGSPAEVRDATRAALECAATRGTVCLGIPDEWMKQDAAAPGRSSPATPDRRTTEPAPGETVSLIADFLEMGWTATRPVILAGRGAVEAGAGDALRRLGELTGSLLATTMQARSLFAGDPYCVGVCGESATPLASELVGDANCVFVFGAALNEYTTVRGALLRNARVIQVDDDAEAIGPLADPELAVVGDARSTALALVAELEGRGRNSVGYRTPEVRERIEGEEVAATVRDRSGPGCVDPEMLVIELDRHLPRDRIVVLDGGEFMGATFAFMDVQRPSDFVQVNSNWPTIGLGIGAAIGAATACPSRTTVLSAGDAGLMMSLGDLETAVRHRLPIVIVVNNDQAWGSEAMFLKSQGLPVDVARVPAPSFAAIATAMGCDGRSVTSIDDVLAAAGELDRVGRGPLVLDCRIDAAWAA